MVEAAVFPDRPTLLGAVKGVLAQYAGTAVTLRQLYYRLVAGRVIPNSFRAYKNLGNAMTTWRRERTIPISALEDRTRGMKVLDQGWRNDNPKGWLLACLKGSVQAAENYELARWYGQPKRVVVAVEKQALEGPFEQVCQELEVDLAVCRGYPSISFLKEMSDVMRDSKGRENVLLYFGDHDASGQDIPRAVREDLGPSLFHNHFEYERIALNPEQVSEYNLDPAPLKLSDSRASGFAEKFGDEVYELDAIEPNALQDIIRDAVNEHFDDDIFEDREGRVEKGKKLISGILKRRGVHKLLKELEEGVGDTEDTDDEDSDDDDSDDDEGSDDDE